MLIALVQSEVARAFKKALLGTGRKPIRSAAPKHHGALVAYLLGPAFRRMSEQWRTFGAVWLLGFA